MKKEDPEYQTVDFMFRHDPNAKDGLQIVFVNTGIDLDNPEQNRKVEILLKIFGAQLVAIADGISPENVVYDTDYIKNKNKAKRP